MSLVLMPYGIFGSSASKKKSLQAREIIFKTAGMKIHSPGLSLARLAMDL
jgi:hypothetical protein